MVELTKAELEQLKMLLDERNDAQLRLFLGKMHPADIAELFDEHSIEESIYMYRLLDGDAAADVLMELDKDERKEILAHLTNEEIADTFVLNMDTDDAVDLMREFDEKQKDEILSHLNRSDGEQAGEIVDLMRYPEDSAGGVMRKEMVVINENWSMPTCVEEMRHQAEELDELYYIYVVDNEERLTGVLPIKKVITKPSAAKIRNVMETDPISIRVDDTIDEVITTFDRYDLVAIPVVDEIGRLVGTITVDDVVDEMREQHEKDLQIASGLTQEIDNTDTIGKQARGRLPWLLIGMIGGILNSALLGRFESVFLLNPMLPVFIPLIGGTGGNVGIQSSAIIVQGLANNSVEWGDMRKLLGKEFVVSLINASIIGGLVLLYNYFFIQSTIVMFSVPISLFCVVLFASIFGSIIPLVLEKRNIDPARAMGPFITILNDLIGMLIYMLVTSALYNALPS